VVREPLGVFADAVRMDHCDRNDDPCMQISAPIAQQTAVGHLMRQRMLEGVFEVRE
jgi:hypothetical protein